MQAPLGRPKARRQVALVIGSGALKCAAVVPVIPEFENRIGLRDVHLVPYLVERGEHAAEQQMPYLCHLMALPVAAVSPAVA